MKKTITLFFAIVFCSFLFCGCSAFCEHEYGDYKIDVYPTDEDDGTRTKTCVKCGVTATEPFSASQGLELYYSEKENICVVRGIGDCKESVIVIPSAYVTSTAVCPVSIITADAFKGCEYITEIIIPDGVTLIGDNAFDYCTSLKKVNIPSTVERIGAEVFNGSANVEIDVCEENPYYSGKGNCLVEKEGGTLISGFNSSVIPDDLEIKKIAPFAFYKCKELKEITIPESVAEIGEEAFAYCEALTKVTIKGSETIGYNAFGSCVSLESLELPNNLKTVGISAFAHAAICEVVIPEGTDRIERSAFSYCEKLETVDMADSVTFIGDSAFMNCKALAKIDLPASLTVIEEYAFRWCVNLASVTFPEGVKEIGYYTFNGCASLTSVTFANGLEKLGDGAFGGCYRLTEVTLPKTLVSIDYNAFSNCTALKSVRFGGTKAEWAAREKDGDWLNRSQLPAEHVITCSDGNIDS